VHRILVLPGDGIGPEVTREARRVLEAAAKAAGLPLQFDDGLIGGAAIDAHGTPLSDDTLALARGSRAVLLGAVGGPKWDKLPVDKRAERGLLRIRKELGLFANLRPAQVFPRSRARRRCAARSSRGSTCSSCASSRAASTSASRAARRSSRAPRGAQHDGVRRDGDRAHRRGRVRVGAPRRREVTHVHKANVLEVSQLWVQVVEEVAKDFPTSSCATSSSTRWRCCS
jgi:3-isopropylmalate dehydrogenase